MSYPVLENLFSNPRESFGSGLQQIYTESTLITRLGKLATPLVLLPKTFDKHFQFRRIFLLMCCKSEAQSHSYSQLSNVLTELSSFQMNLGIC